MASECFRSIVPTELINTLTCHYVLAVVIIFDLQKAILGEMVSMASSTAGDMNMATT